MIQEQDTPAMQPSMPNPGRGRMARPAALVAAALVALVAAAVPVSAVGSPPDAPTAVTARAGDGAARVSWTPPVYTAGLAVTGYTATASPGGATCDATPPATSCTVSGLVNDTAYTFTVRATTSGGTSAASSPSDAATPLAGTEGQNLIGRYGSVKWSGTTIGTDQNVDPLDGVYGGSRGYAVDDVVDATTVNASLCGGAWYWYQILCDLPGAADELSRVYKTSAHSGITFNTSSIPTVRGFVVIDLGAVRTFTTLRIFQMFSDGKVTDVRLSVSSLTGSTWPAYDDGTWTVVAPRTGIGQGLTGSGFVTCPTIIDMGATSGRYLRLESWNAGQFGSPNWVEISAAKLFFENSPAAPGSGCPPEPPTSPVAVASNASASVSWTAAASADPLTSSELQWSDDGGSSWTTAATTPATVPGTATSAIVTGLSNGTGYIFRVLSSNASGTSPYSLPSNEVTPQAVPDAPTDVTATGGDGEALVQWTASASNGSAVTGYLVTSVPDGETCAVVAPATSCTVTGLRNTVTYSFTVIATSVAGPSLPGVSNDVTPAGADPTPTPGGAVLTVTATPSRSTFAAAGERITFTVVATNTGSETLTGVTVAAPDLTDITCDVELPATLAPSESVTCTGTYTVTEADATRGSLAITATGASAETGEVAGEGVALAMPATDAVPATSDAGGQGGELALVLALLGLAVVGMLLAAPRHRRA